MKIMFILFLLILFICIALSVSSAAEVRDIGNAKQLFIDEDMVESMSNVQFTLNPARKAERVLAAEKPWEGMAVSYPTVIKEGDLFRMWYVASFIEPDKIKDWMDNMCYAESTDGIHWKRPNLNQYNFNGSKKNNILSFSKCGYSSGGNVFKDPNAKSEDERYKMIFGDFFRVYPYAGCPNWTTVSGAVSPDGIKWKSINTQHGLLVPSGGTDTQDVAFWDPNIEKYVVYVRDNFYRKDANGKLILPGSRRMGRTESKEYKEFPDPATISVPDEKDPGGIWGCGIYNSAAVIYPYAPNVYLFFPTIYDYNSELATIQFASSRDGANLDRRFREPYIIPDTDIGRLGKEISYGAYMGVGMVRVKDELWMYGGIYYEPHNMYWTQKPTVDRRGIYRFVQRLDGFVSIDAVLKQGIVNTKPFLLQGAILEINANSSLAPLENRYPDFYDRLYGRAGSSLVVDVLDSDGNILASSENLRDDGVALRPKWKDRTNLTEFIGRPVKLQFKMCFAKLYAFQIVDAKSAHRQKVRTVTPPVIPAKYMDVGASDATQEATREK